MVDKIYLDMDGEEVCLLVDKPSDQIIGISFDGVPMDMDEVRAEAERLRTLRN